MTILNQYGNGRVDLWGRETRTCLDLRPIQVFDRARSWARKARIRAELAAIEFDIRSSFFTSSIDWPGLKQEKALGHRHDAGGRTSPS